jgi:regulator of sigma E protease
MNIVVDLILIVFWFIVILIPLVAIHEMGHFLFSKLVGVKIVEYGIGIPPRAVARRWKGVIWSLNWIPLGGFAKIYGDHDAVDAAEDAYTIDPDQAREVYNQTRIGEIVASGDLQYFLKDNNLDYSDEWKAFEQFKGDITPESDEEILYKQLETLVGWEFDEVIHTKKAFCNISWWRKTFILLGGVTFNMITALVLFFLIFGFIGTPRSPILADDLNELRENATITYQSENVKVLKVIKGTAAERSGLKPGDDFISFNNVQINSLNNFQEFADLVQNQQNSEVTIVYRDSQTGVQEESKVSLDERDGKQFFGLSSSDIGYLVQFKSNNLGDAAKQSAMRTGSIFVVNFKALGDVVVALIPGDRDRTALEQVGGPVAIGSLGSSIFDIQGPAGILNVMAVVSVALAAFNLLPIPALDGGRWVIITINALTRRRNKRLESIVIGVTFIAMLGLAAIIAFYDVFRIATGTLGF